MKSIIENYSLLQVANTTGNQALKGWDGAPEKARLMSSDPDGFDTKGRKEGVWVSKLNLV